MEFDYKFLYKKLINLKVTDDPNEIRGKTHSIVINPLDFREIKRQLKYLEELRQDSKRYVLELNTADNKNKVLKKENELLKEKNEYLQKELDIKKAEEKPVSDSQELEEKLEEKNDEIVDLKRQLNNLSSIINSKNKKVSKLENKVSSLESKVSKLKSKKITKNKNEIAEENKIIPTYKSLIIKKELNVKEYKIQKNYILNIPLDAPIIDVKTYIEDIDNNEEELAKYINENKYVVWKVQTKNNVWELVLLKKDLKDLDENEQSDIEFSSQSAILKTLFREKSYTLKQHYTLPIKIETPIGEVVKYVKESQETNIALEKEKNGDVNVAWKVQTKNNTWEVVFRGRI